MCPAHAVPRVAVPCEFGAQTKHRQIASPSHSLHTRLPRPQPCTQVTFLYVHLCTVRHVQVSDRLADSQDLQPLQASLWTPPDVANSHDGLCAVPELAPLSTVVPSFLVTLQPLQCSQLAYSPRTRLSCTF